MRFASFGHVPPVQDSTLWLSQSVEQTGQVVCTIVGQAGQVVGTVVGQVIGTVVGHVVGTVVGQAGQVGGSGRLLLHPFTSAVVSTKEKFGDERMVYRRPLSPYSGPY